MATKGRKSLALALGNPIEKDAEGFDDIAAFWSATGKYISLSLYLF